MIKWGGFAAVAAIFISIFTGILFGVNPLFIFLRALIFGIVFFGIGFGLKFVIGSFFPEILETNANETPEQREAGSQINITVDNSTGEYAVPELYKTRGDPDEMGNIEDLISGLFKPRRSDDDDIFVSNKQEAPRPAIDRKRESGYNNEKFDVSQLQGDGFDVDDWGGGIDEPSADSRDETEKRGAAAPQFSSSFGDDVGMESMPDLDLMAQAFSGFGGGSPMPSPVSSSPAVQEFIPTQPVAQFEAAEPDRDQYKGNKPQQMEVDFDPKDMAKGISTILNKDR